MDKQIQMDAEELRKYSQIYKKPNLTDYQQRVNTAAENICLKNPSMIRKRAELLERARQEVHDSGYTYRKGKSRSKRFGTSDSTPKRPKFHHDYRERRMKELGEDLVGISERISIKESRCEAGAAVKNFKLCDQLSEEIAELKQQRRLKEAELRELKKREKKSQWYLKKKRLSATDDSDFIESSDDNESSSTTSKRSRSDTPKSTFHVPQPLSPLSPHSTHSPSPYPCSIETGTSRSTSIEIPSDDEPPTANSPPEQHF